MDYLEFRREYEVQHPASVPQLEVEMNEYPGWVRYAVLLTFISAAMVSGVHTVPTVWQGIPVGEIITSDVRNWAALASLLMVEFAILLSAYLMIKGQFLAYVIVTIASVVAIGANLYSVINTFNADGNLGVIIVAVIMGIGAPLIALFTGKMYVDIHRADRIQDSRSKKAYKEAGIKWDKEIERAYKQYKKEQAAQTNNLNQPTPRLSAQTNTDKQPKHAALEYLHNNPGNYTVRSLAEAAGVTNDAAHKALKMYSENGHSKNGTS